MKPQLPTWARLAGWGLVATLGCSHSAPAGQPHARAAEQDEQSPAAVAVRLERIVAVVDKDVITEGELYAEAKVALAWRHGAQAGQLAVPQNFLQAFLDHLIGQMLVAREARRMGFDEASEADVDQRLAALRDRFASQSKYSAFVSSLHMGAGFVHDVLARDLKNERYVSQRLRTRMVGADLRARSDERWGSSAAGSLPRPNVAALMHEWLTEMRRTVEVLVLDGDGTLQRERPRT